MNSLIDNRDDHCAVIVAFTPYQALFASNFVSDISAKNIVCCFTSDVDWLKLNKNIKQVNIESSSILSMFFSFFRFRNELKKIIAEYSEIDIYISHPFHVISNYLFFHPKITNRYIFEDGIMNYYDAQVPKTKKMKELIKRAVSRVLGFPFTDYQGFLSGVGERPYDGAYLSYPSSAVKKECLGKLTQVRAAATSGLNLKHDRILFLDQPTDAFMDAETKKNAVLQLLDECEGKSVYYKPHPSDTSNPQWPSLNIIALQQGLKSMPAELVINEILPGKVISFSSSALINIKSLYPDIECISIGTKKLPVSINGKQQMLSDIFERFDVVCL